MNTKLRVKAYTFGTTTYYRWEGHGTYRVDTYDVMPVTWDDVVEFCRVPYVGY